MILNWLKNKIFTFDGKNSAFLKSFRMTDVVNVPKNSTTDMRKTFGIGSGLSQSSPTRVPLSRWQIKQIDIKIEFGKS